MSDPADGAPGRSRVRIGLGAAAVLLAVGVSCAVVFSAVAPRGESVSVAPGAGAGAALGSLATAAPTAVAPATGIFVHILGAVNEPGLYELHDGDRAVDAVAAAGGFAAEADRSQLNLARFVTDGEQIVVPVLGAPPPASTGGVAGGGVAGGGAAVPGKVNLNTADAATLETLPRVGPAMAQRIIAWREENGRFAAIEDLMSVSGVGEKTFDSLRDLVTI
jgi:competence protein ComEA